VRIEVDAVLGPAIACHCSQCRRSTGSAFNTNASVSAHSYRIVAAKELAREFSKSPGHYRAFCSQCGSPLYGRSDLFPAIWRVRLGTLEKTNGVHLIAHIFTGSKADWFDITDKLKQFEAYPTTDASPYFRTAE
jgi:hypothetical protein